MKLKRIPPSSSLGALPRQNNHEFVQIGTILNSLHLKHPCGNPLRMLNNIFYNISGNVIFYKKNYFIRFINENVMMECYRKDILNSIIV